VDTRLYIDIEWHGEKMTKLIVMSFKPLYALKIVRGEKDCEVRTYFGIVEQGDRVIIYASSPRRAFLGVFEVHDVLVGDYNNVVWYLNRCCVMFDEDNWRFVEEHYARSTRKLMVIKIGKVRVFPREIALHEVKSYIPSFRPPLSYTLARYELVNVLRQILGSSVWEDLIT